MTDWPRHDIPADCMLISGPLLLLKTEILQVKNELYRLISKEFQALFIWANFSGCHAGASPSPAEDSEAEGGTHVIPRPAQQRRRQESLIGAGLANFPQSYQHFSASLVKFPQRFPEMQNESHHLIS